LSIIPAIMGPLLAAYTAVLLLAGRLGLLRHRDAGGFVTAGRRLGGWHVFVLVTALWTSWIYVTELDEGFAVGISALWFGIAVLVMSLVVAALFVTPFRRLGFVTNSGLLGDAFGPPARFFSAVVIALTFPIFALGNVLAAAAVLHALFGWPLLAAEAATLAVMMAYVAFGGLTSLVYTQTINLAVMLAGLLATAIVAGQHSGWTAAGPKASWLGIDPWSWTAVGAGTILVWLVSDLVNVVSAQVEFQAVTAVERPAVARRAVVGSTGVLALVTVAAAYLGLKTHAADPHAATGVLAFPHLLFTAMPVPVQVLGAASIWAAALTWSAPLLFSGASSLGLDIARPALRVSTPEAARRLVRWGLPLQAAAVLFYTALRPGDLAWWSVFALTVRNAAIFAPTVGLLLWPVSDARAAVAAMVAGVAAGLGWNALSGFSPSTFALGINPAWVGTSVSIVVFLVTSLLVNRRRTAWRWPARLYGYVGWLMALAAAAALAVAGPVWVRTGWAGLWLLVGAVGLELGVGCCCRLAAPAFERVRSDEQFAP
jgi:SSS family solute:Na+ symporter